MIIVLLAEGFEEIEALTPVDMMRRAGLDVKTVGIAGKTVRGAHNISVVADATPDEIDLCAVDESEYTDKVIAAVKNNGGRLAAICAAPLVLGRRGLLEGRKATCFPGFENELKGATVVDADFVTDGNITTGRGMEYSLPFAKELVKLLEK